MIENCFRYALKVWLTTVLSGSFVLSFVISFGTIGKTIEVCLWITLAALFLSCPAWITFLIAVFLLFTLNHTIKARKIFLHLFSTVLVLTTMIFVAPDSENLSSSLPIIVPYFICLAISVQFYKLPQHYTE